MTPLLLAHVTLDPVLFVAAIAALPFMIVIIAVVADKLGIE